MENLLQLAREIEKSCHERGLTVAAYLAGMLVLEIAEQELREYLAAEPGDVDVEPVSCACVGQG